MNPNYIRRQTVLYLNLKSEVAALLPIDTAPPETDGVHPLTPPGVRVSYRAVRKPMSPVPYSVPTSICNSQQRLLAETGGNNYEKHDSDFNSDFHYWTESSRFDKI